VDTGFAEQNTIKKGEPRDDHKDRQAAIQHTKSPFISEFDRVRINNLPYRKKTACRT
jgi:hypothetical protein